MKETIKKEIEKIKERNEKMLKAFIPPFYEIEYNRGYIDGLRFALEQSKKEEVHECKTCRWGEEGGNLCASEYMCSCGYPDLWEAKKKREG